MNLQKNHAVELRPFVEQRAYKEKEDSVTKDKRRRVHIHTKLSSGEMLSRLIVDVDGGFTQELGDPVIVRHECVPDQETSRSLLAHELL